MNNTILVIFVAAVLGCPAFGLAQTADGASTSASADPQRSTQVDPPPPHTGWATLIKDSAHDFAALPRRRSTWTLLAIAGASALAAHPGDDYVERHIVGNQTADHVFVVGKWLGSAEVQIGTAVGLWAVGRYVVPAATDESKTNTLSHLGFDLIRAQILSQALVHGIKYSVRRDRPTGECCAFPSGHATTAFAAASVIERHLGYRASWPALAAATYVATSRLVDDRHFLSDVVFGAGLGMASGWTVVGRHGRTNYTLQPVPVDHGMMVAVSRQVTPHH
jgi:membrane-associated phospholipid phosphatase